MLVKEVMTLQVINVKTDTLLGRTAGVLHKYKLKGLPVINEYGIVEGLITENELFSSDKKIYLPMYGELLKHTEFVANSQSDGLSYEAERITRITAREIMNSKVYFASPETEVKDLAAKVANLNQDPIPVTNSGNKLVGIISKSDIIRALTGVEKIKSENSKSRNYVENEVRFVEEDISSRFAFISKTRARFWMLGVTIIFIAGFIAGVMYVVNPKIFTNGF
jgi:CBS domain-containing protein